MELKPTFISGCFELQPSLHVDARGLFVKPFQASVFKKLGLCSDFTEDFFSHSRKGVIRGLHFQAPPHALAKLVYCPQGKVLDIALDLRVGSPTYGRHFAFELSSEKGNQLYLPIGMAHGFCSLTEDSIVAYKVSAEYSPKHDQGVRWDSCGVSWPNIEVSLSERDRRFPTWAEFKSPFRYE